MDVLQQILGFTLLIIFLLLLIALALIVIATVFIATLWWVWAILTIVFFFFRNRRIGGWIFRKAWKLLVIAVVLNVIGVILLIAFPSLREYDNDDAIRSRIEREVNDNVDESNVTTNCRKADGGEVFDEDATGIELEYYTFVVWEDNGTERYTVLSPGTYDFRRTIYAGKASGYAGNECNTATVKAIVGKHSWASKATVDKFFDKRE